MLLLLDSWSAAAAAAAAATAAAASSASTVSAADSMHLLFLLGKGLKFTKQNMKEKSLLFLPENLIAITFHQERANLAMTSFWSNPIAHG